MGHYTIPDLIVNDLRAEKNLVVVGDASLKGAVSIGGAAAIGNASTDTLKFYGIASGVAQPGLIADSATVIETNTARINSIIDVLQGCGLCATS